MSQYAAGTEVSSERSRAEIERTLHRYGARQFMYGYDETRVIVAFNIKDRQVRFVVQMPHIEDKEFKWSNHKPPRRHTVNQQIAAHEAAVRQRWRALALVIKAKLEAVESKIVTFDAEFLAQLVLPNGQTVADAVVPRVAEAYETNQMPQLLPDYPKALPSRNEPPDLSQN